MKYFRKEGEPELEQEKNAIPLVLPLSALDRSMIPQVGGKASNLGELIRAGFMVPEGFCITTAAYMRACADAGLDANLAALAATELEDGAHRAELAARIRMALLEAPLDASIVEAVTSAYQVLSSEEPFPVAVRSSATAEDLQEASFAGQQETYLNIIGVECLLQALRQCFASLWTERAVSYRANLNIDPRTVRLAVIVQRMVEARTAGVLFTANPLTGKRRQVVINANPGLGEAVVSGITNPDHFVVNSTTGEIVERRNGEKQVIIQAAAGGGTQAVDSRESKDVACLTDKQISMLVKLGARVETHYGTPQDIEWAIDAAGRIFLLQARPITTLFPLPVDAPTTDETLRVYLSFGIQQGTYRPFTPLGLSTLRLIASGFSAFVGFPPGDPIGGPGFVTEAACRLFFDVTGALRTSFGRRFLIQAMEEAEVHAAASFRYLITDVRLSLVKTSRLAFARALFLLLVRSNMLWYLLQALVSPTAADRRIARLVNTMREADSEEYVDAAARLAAVERLLYESPRLLFRVSPAMLAGMQTFALAKRLLGDLATASECQVVIGGSPSNPTTRMNLALWALSEQIRADPEEARLVQDTSVTQIAEAYRRGSLPPSLQRGLARFLQEYGHLGVAELDLGVPRWSEDPDTLVTNLVNYQQVRDLTQAPDVQFQRARDSARTMVATLSRRAIQRHRLRGRLVGFCLRCAHSLSGFREMTRFFVALMLARVRSLLLPVGEELLQAGRLTQAADIFFLTLPEAHEALDGTDMRVRASSRHATYEEERSRRHVPLILLSDGTEPVAESQSTLESGALQGVGASPGVVTGKARVILDPRGASLAPGEILVAPTTDPGWTPLFLIAGGLVMEKGGAMAHGAIVAREYGIPAVVGVTGATERISTGTRLIVDGSAGTIIIEQANEMVK